MHFSFLALLPLVALAQAQFESCGSFWKNVKPEDKKFLVNAKCHVFPGYPKTFGSTKFTVTYTQKWSQAGAKTDKIAPVLLESIADSVKYYEAFADLPKHIVIILTTDVDGPYTAETYYPVEHQSPCQIKTFQRWTDNAGTKVPRALQALSHEIYHCIQGKALGNTGGPTWVFEGSANYFSNLVFPKSNAEWPGLEYTYNPAFPIYAQVGRDVYTTSLYFQSLEDTRSRNYLHDWVLKTDQTSSNAEERSRLSKLADFTDDFYKFAEQFSLMSIRDTSGVIIPLLTQITPVPVKVLLNAAGTTGTASLQTIPFSITFFKIWLKAGSEATVYASAAENQRVAYRKPGEHTWTKMPHGAQEDAVLVCNEDGSGSSIFILFVSTANAKSDTLKVTVKRDRTKDCKKPGPGGFVLYPLYDEKTGGARCPAGTHFADIAAWCCPQGMTLDHDVAQQASICCPTEADCSKAIIPNHLRCADPKWVLWSRDFRDVGCCQKGYFPNSRRYCTSDTEEHDPRFSMIPQT
ncbi:Fc.00g106290.m01.CDS01 [Cosmosporella sp. VM-42]